MRLEPHGCHLGKRIAARRYAADFAPAVEQPRSTAAQRREYRRRHSARAPGGRGPRSATHRLLCPRRESRRWVAQMRDWSRSPRATKILPHVHFASDEIHSEPSSESTVVRATAGIPIPGVVGGFGETAPDRSGRQSLAESLSQCLGAHSRPRCFAEIADREEHFRKVVMVHIARLVADSGQCVRRARICSSPRMSPMLTKASPCTDCSLASPTASPDSSACSMAGLSNSTASAARLALRSRNALIAANLGASRWSRSAMHTRLLELRSLAPAPNQPHTQ